MCLCQFLAVPPPQSLIVLPEAAVFTLARQVPVLPWCLPWHLCQMQERGAHAGPAAQQGRWRQCRCDAHNPSQVREEREVGLGGKWGRRGRESTRENKQKGEMDEQDSSERQECKQRRIFNRGGNESSSPASRGPQQAGSFVLSDCGLFLAVRLGWWAHASCSHSNLPEGQGPSLEQRGLARPDAYGDGRIDLTELVAGHRFRSPTTHFWKHNPGLPFTAGKGTTPFVSHHLPSLWDHRGSCGCGSLSQMDPSKELVHDIVFLFKGS